MYKKLFFIFYFWGWALICIAQKFEWVKSFGGTGAENNPLCLQTRKAGYLTWIGVSNTSLGVFTIKQKYPTIACVGKLDKDGKPLWLWASDSIFGPIQFNSIINDTISENIYITGYLEGIVYYGNESYHSYYSQSKKKYSRNGFVMKMNKNGTPMKFFVIEDTNYNRINDIKIYENKLFIPIGFGASLSQKFCALKPMCYTNGGFVLCVLDTSLNINAKSKLINIPDYNFLNEQLNINNDKIILTTYAANISYQDSLIAFKDTSNGGYFSISLDKSLRVKRIDKLFSGTVLKASSAMTEKGEIIVGTAFLDSIVFKNKTIISKQYTKPIVLIFNTNYEIEYATYPSSIVTGSSSQILTLEYHNGYIYTGGRVQGDFHFGDIYTYENEGRVFIAKLDLFGSFLWTKRFSTSKKLNSLNHISAFNKKVLAVSDFNDTAHLNSQQFISNGSLDLLVAKIHDIEITRGYVKRGPYCAGDTIPIPYTKNGSFNPSNQFIAQLSDENGNFEGKERELGRINSDTDGVIKGVLPLFDVESSPNYRIRILSTSPVVQSYYKYDTLRLLIYSKDTANAGSDTLICKGQTLKLSTSGGSRWHWSPGNLVADSTAKTTTAFPLKTTKYRIIISDSSGCGKTDTAYKTVIIRPPLEIKGLPADTAVCKNSRVLLKINPSGGLASGYTYQWLSSSNLVLGLTDTFSLQLAKALSIKAVLSDGCSISNDTQLVTLHFPPFSFTQLLKDTLVCAGSKPVLKLLPSAGKSYDFDFKWYNSFGQLLATTDTLHYAVSQSETLKAIITHHCSDINDTSFIKLLLPPAIIAKIEKPPCFDSSLILKIKATGGYKNTLSHLWFKNGKAIDLGNSLNLTGVYNKQWIVSLSTDYCQAVVKDSVRLIPRPKAILISSTDSICQYQPLGLSNQSVYSSPIQSALNKRPWQSKDTTLGFNQTGAQILTLHITDSMACVDESSHNITVIEKPDAGFTTIPQIPTSDHAQIEFIPLQTGYKKYLWNIGALLLNQSSPSAVRLPIEDTISYLTKLTVTNAFGCTDTVSKTIKVSPSLAFYIPNAVSRNDDGLNDEFAPFGWKVLSYHMLIVARTNQVVYKGSTPWKPEFEDGVYSYVIKVKFKDGSENTFQGHVHVLH